ncbi:MAG: hypothetical protein JWQ21_49 [Herminiimonas sp.]|nr:hypothetical protein [Herminiimonas sp.]
MSTDVLQGIGLLDALERFSYQCMSAAGRFSIHNETPHRAIAKFV